MALSRVVGGQESEPLGNRSAAHCEITIELAAELGTVRGVCRPEHDKVELGRE
jgi:hypothetical protein